MVLKKKAPQAVRHATGKTRPVPRKSNPNLNAQTRKVLSQHYRAKYGVK